MYSLYVKIMLTMTPSKIWSEYDAQAEQAEVPEQDEDTGALKPEYHDVIISDTRTHNGLTFSIQILDTEGDCGPSPRKTNRSFDP